MQRRKARPNRIFMLQVLYNSPLLLRGHFKWTQNISERVKLKQTMLCTTLLLRRVKALVSLSILGL